MNTTTWDETSIIWDGVTWGDVSHVPTWDNEELEWDSNEVLWED